MKDKLNQLHQAIALAEIILRDGEPADGWPGKQYLIGIHSRWLTEAEADQAIISFSQITDAAYYTHYAAQEAKLVRFFLALHQQDELLVFDEVAKQFLPIRAVPELIQLITLSTRELHHYSIYSPALHTIFVDGFDVASVAYVLPGEKNNATLASLHQLAQENGLHVLQ